MRLPVPLVSFVLFCLGAPAAFADSKSVDLFHAKDWDVRLVTWDDGSSSCVAEVSYDNGDAFSIWRDRSHPIRLQFYSDGWSFGSDDSYADVALEVDSHNSWKVTKADFYKNSVLIDLPTGPSADQFLAEIESGDTLYLYDDKGKEQSSYSLAGSQASISALNGCLGQLH